MKVLCNPVFFLCEKALGLDIKPLPLEKRSGSSKQNKNTYLLGDKGRVHKFC